ncbi:MAG: sugar phosphate isomerase/epimerase family protein [Anaerolineae bacterium]
MVSLAASTQLFGAQLLQEEHLRAIRNAGFRHVELFASPGHFDWEDRGTVMRIRAALRALELTVCSLHAPWAPGQDVASLDALCRQRSLEAIARAMDALVAVGGDVLVMHPGAAVQDRRRAAEQLALAEESIRRVAQWAADLGVRVALENPPPYELAGDMASLLALYNRLADEPVVQACFDTGHAHLLPEGVEAVHAVMKDLLVVHLSDNMGSADDHLPPEAGTIPWPTLLSALHDAGFTGAAVLELTDLPEPEEVLVKGWQWMAEQWPEAAP